MGPPPQKDKKAFKYFDTQAWQTPGEESLAYVAQLGGGGSQLRRSRSVPSCRALFSDGTNMKVQIDGASLKAIANFAAPIRPMPRDFSRLSILSG